MEEKTINQQNEELDIDLSRLVGALMNRAWLIGLVALVFAVLAFVYTYFFVTPLYQASASFYVNNSSISLGEASVSISSADISASRGLVKSYIAILKTRETLNDVIDYAGAKMSYGQLKGMISASSVDNTEIFQVTVTHPDPEQAEHLANSIAYILPKRIASIIEGTSAKVVEAAVVPSGPSSPSYSRNTLLGFAVGFAFMSLLVVVMELMDISIRSEEDISQNCKYPILATVPDMEAAAKGGYYYGYSRKKSAYDKSSSKGQKQTQLVGGNISFTAAEAYKILRTKLQFSFSEEGECHVIGVSSALTGEGKSLSAVNLAYSTSQLGKRVLLIDCDMRRPSLADKLPIRKSPGLSDYLTGQSGADKLLQHCGIKNEERAFHAISSGRTPPNPMELLSSPKMEKMLELLRQNYDYIILVLPPVGEVGDALAVAKLTDGMLVVVRQDYCDRIALNSAIRQFEFVEAKILGVVFNSVNEDASGYGSKYYHRYYRRYYRRYSKYGYRKYGYRKYGYRKHGYGEKVRTPENKKNETKTEV